MTVYCPVCGTQAPSEQKFCRSCGMELQIISRSVAERLGEIPEPPGNQHQRVERWGEIISMSGLSILILWLTYLFIVIAASKLFGVRFEAFGVELVFALAAAAGFPLMFLGILVKSYSQGIAGVLNRQSQPSARLTAKTTRKLSAKIPASAFDSVTEQTTKSLGTAEACDRGKAPSPDTSAK